MHSTKQVEISKKHKASSAIFVNFPHSGLNIPSDIEITMHKDVVDQRPDTDWDLPSIYRPILEGKYPSQEALMHRYVVDLNRDPSGKSLYNDSRYISAIVPAKTFSEKDIYPTPPTQPQVEARVKKYFWSYHQELTENLKTNRTKLMIDAHSISRNVPSLFKGDLPDIILGNGGDLETAPIAWLEAGATALKKHGFSVAINEPFRGGWITRSYPTRIESLKTIQIEMCNDLYLQNPAGPQISKDANPLKSKGNWDKVKVSKLRRGLESLLLVWSELAI